jgi:subtilisin-like proprotein convertase family protein
MNSTHRQHAPSTDTRIEMLENRIAPAGFIFAANAGVVKTFTDSNADGTYDKTVESFVPFPGYRLEVRVAVGDFNGDGNDELAVATAGRNPQVKVFQLGGDGTRIGPGDLILPFVGSKIVGVWPAAGDLNNDGKDELLLGAGTGGPASVEIYSDTDGDGLLSDNLVDTLAVFDVKFKGGVRVAAGNTDNTGGDELIAAAGRGGNNGQVKIYSDVNSNRILSDDATGLLETFTPFGPKFAGGLIVAAGGISSAGNGGAEVSIAKGTATKDFVIFTDSDSTGKVSDNALFDTVLVTTKAAGRGLRLAMGDTDNSGFFVEVIAASGGGRALPLQIFDDTADAGLLLSDNGPTGSFTGFNVGTPVNVAFGKVVSATYAMNAFPQSIPDGSSVVSSIFVPANAGRITDLDVSLNIFHSFDGDLDITLTNVASGISVILFQDVGGSNEGFLVRLNDEAGTDISTATNPKLDGAISGTFNPGGAALLSVFDGLDASGEWRLSITDDSGGDIGTLFGWALHVST